MPALLIDACMNKLIFLFLGLLMGFSAAANDFDPAEFNKDPYKKMRERTDRCHVDCEQMLFIYREKLLRDAEKVRNQYKREFSNTELSGSSAEEEIAQGLVYFLGYGKLLSRVRKVEVLARKSWNEPLNDKEKQTLNELCHSGWDVNKYAIRGL